MTRPEPMSKANDELREMAEKMTDWLYAECVPPSAETNYLEKCLRAAYEAGRREGILGWDRHVQSVSNARAEGHRQGEIAMRERAAKVVKRAKKYHEHSGYTCACVEAIEALEPETEGKLWTCNGCGKENPLIHHVLECDKPKKPEGGV